ncbi:helix-turn-helix transcriptional regulator [Yoonia algicola]|uniref:LuxR C-terminal-related transcriptional regulator n=1 Tax=Yoonia algicola TaxID=3137368 RepID=A0AAN0M347_9RHOB
MSTLDQVGAVLMEIHELPERVPFDEFQDAALQAVKRVVSFDAAWWGLVAGLEIHSATRFELPEGYRRHWESVREHDPIASAALGAPFVTVRFNHQDLETYPEISNFLEVYGIHHVLCTATRQRDLALYAFLSLYRNDAPFTEEERSVKQVLVPHLLHALGQSWRRNMERGLQSLNGQPDIRAAAICDRRGLVLSSEAALQGVLRREWPSWQGPHLPETLEQALSRNDRFVGTHIQVKIDAVSGLFLLRLSERDPFDDLTQREADVARLFAEGHTYKEVARELNLAPSTARHYLRNVYSKLDVSDKAALAILLVRRDEGSEMARFTVV